MGFGCSFSLYKVEPGDWLQTKLWKRIVRTVLGLSLYFGMFRFFRYYFIFDRTQANFAVNLVIPYIIYGPYLVFCDMIGLVDNSRSDDQENYQVQL